VNIFKVSDVRPISGEMMYVSPRIWGNWDSVTRWSATHWTVSMGESEEEIYDERLVAELEAAYQEYKKENK